MEMAVMRNGRLRQACRCDKMRRLCHAEVSSHRNYVSSVRIIQALQAYLSSSPDCSPP